MFWVEEKGRKTSTHIKPENSYRNCFFEPQRHEKRGKSKMKVHAGHRKSKMIFFPSCPLRTLNRRSWWGKIYINNNQRKITKIYSRRACQTDYWNPKTKNKRELEKYKTNDNVFMERDIGLNLKETLKKVWRILTGRRIRKMIFL